MTRRQLLTVAAGGAILRRAEAADYRDYSHCLPDYLRSLARQAYAKRNAAIAELKTEAAIRERQRWVRETFWNLVGGTPAHSGSRSAARARERPWWTRPHPPRHEAR